VIKRSRFIIKCKDQVQDLLNGRMVVDNILFIMAIIVFTKEDSTQLLNTIHLITILDYREE
jgi:hypothetical protein